MTLLINIGNSEPSDLTKMNAEEKKEIINDKNAKDGPEYDNLSGIMMSLPTNTQINEVIDLGDFRSIIFLILPFLNEIFATLNSSNMIPSWFYSPTSSNPHHIFIKSIIDSIAVIGITLNTSNFSIRTGSMWVGLMIAIGIVTIAFLTPSIIFPLIRNIGKNNWTNFAFGLFVIALLFTLEIIWITRVNLSYKRIISVQEKNTQSSISNISLLLFLVGVIILFLLVGFSTWISFGKGQQNLYRPLFLLAVMYVVLIGVLVIPIIQKGIDDIIN